MGENDLVLREFTEIFKDEGHDYATDFPTVQKKRERERERGEGAGPWRRKERKCEKTLTKMNLGKWYMEVPSLFANFLLVCNYIQ